MATFPESVLEAGRQIGLVLERVKAGTSKKDEKKNSEPTKNKTQNSLMTKVGVAELGEEIKEFNYYMTISLVLDA